VDAESSARGWLGVFFGSTPGRRVIVAFAIAIALHEVAAGLISPNPAAEQQQREIVTRAAIVRVSLASTPTPAPLPSLVAPSPLVSPAARPIARIDEGRRGGAAPKRETESPRRAEHDAPNAKPIWDVAGGDVASGASLGATGTTAGSGSGSGSQGNGTGAASGDEPCGFVTFSDPHGSHYDPRTHGFWVDIRMSVHLADGSSQSMALDYPWYYSSEADNPWSDQNLRDPNFPTRFQPPPASKIAAEPELVKYVVAHSTADGLTLLRDCATPAPAQGAQHAN